MAEWLKAHAWKACKGAILSWVRIPFSPPLNKPHFIIQFLSSLNVVMQYNSAFFLKNGIIQLFQLLKNDR